MKKSTLYSPSVQPGSCGDIFNPTEDESVSNELIPAGSQVFAVCQPTCQLSDLESLVPELEVQKQHAED